MTRLLIAAAMIAAAGAAVAQPAPSPSPPGAADAPAVAARPMGQRGASIKIARPDITVAVRCADGDTTRACGEIVAQLIEKLAAMQQPERRAMGERGGRDPERMRRGYRDRGEDDDRDRE